MFAYSAKFSLNKKENTRSYSSLHHIQQGIWPVDLFCTVGSLLYNATHVHWIPEAICVVLTFFLSLHFIFWILKLPNAEEAKKKHTNTHFFFNNRFGTSFYVVYTIFNTILLLAIKNSSVAFLVLVFWSHVQLYYYCFFLFQSVSVAAAAYFIYFFQAFFRGSFSLRVIFLYNCVIIWIYSWQTIFFFSLSPTFMAVSLMAWFLIECFLWRLITIIIKISYQHKRGNSKVQKKEYYSTSD